jgi:hypothetical protein
MGEKEQLERLHDAFVWEVNAAVGEDRLDLVWQLADDYLDQALRLVTDGAPTGCGRADCAVCSGPRTTPPTPRRRRWRRRSRGGRAG